MSFPADATKFAPKTFGKRLSELVASRHQRRSGWSTKRCNVKIRETNRFGMQSIQIRCLLRRIPMT